MAQNSGWNSLALSFMMARSNRRTILFHAEADHYAYLVRIKSIVMPDPLSIR
jgi:hypothetical protein